MVGGLEKAYFVGFLFSLAATALLALLYLVWWWTNRRLRLADRVFGFLLVVGGGLLVAPFCHPSISLFGLLTTGLSFVLTAATLWMLVSRKLAPAWKRLGAVAVVMLTWGFFTLIRIDGVNAALKPDFAWRCQPTAEERFLAEKTQTAGGAGEEAPAAGADWTPSLGPNTWTGSAGRSATA